MSTLEDLRQTVAVLDEAMTRRDELILQAATKEGVSQEAIAQAAGMSQPGVSSLIRRLSR